MAVGLLLEEVVVISDVVVEGDDIVVEVVKTNQLIQLSINAMDLGLPVSTLLVTVTPQQAAAINPERVPAEPVWNFTIMGEPQLVKGPGVGPGMSLNWLQYFWLKDPYDIST